MDCVAAQFLLLERSALSSCIVLPSEALVRRGEGVFSTPDLDGGRDLIRARLTSRLSPLAFHQTLTRAGVLCARAQTSLWMP